MENNLERIAAALELIAAHLALIAAQLDPEALEKRRMAMYEQLARAGRGSGGRICENLLTKR